ncbi:bifunctional diguanylate cyclase/phosphodiesterase [Arenimonas caeni]|uniref:cyclic-guanylate-specific phosphodiesterase n=1 Tax=Arenimonas caeni TaxID=2058085 RepID=A0A2P6MCZ7_9GAMM|nr:EAL domain-containing protein [Arenimonas caeni]PRH83867.1 hypothetical protein C6N40_01625 [Arenimonas caeni]
MITRLLTSRPASQVLPVLLLLLALAAAAVQMLVGLSDVQQRAERDTAGDMADLLLHQGRRIDMQAELGIEYLPERIVSGLAADLRVKGAWLVDGQGSVRAAIHRRDIGQPFTEVASQRPKALGDALLDAAFRARPGRSLAAAPGQLAVSRQVLLSSDPPRYAMLVVEADSVPVAAQLRAEAGRTFWANSAGIVAVITIIWGLFHLVWTRRSSLLADAAGHLQFEGEPLRTGVSGGDELARVARAVEQASERLEHQSRLLRTVSCVSLAGQRLTDRDALSAEICRLLVQEGGYTLAGMARVQPDGRTILPTALFGVRQDQLPVSAGDLEDPDQADRPAVRVLLTGEPLVFADLDELPGRHPATEPFHRLGMRSLVVVPLVEMGERLGVLYLADRRPGIFDHSFLSAVSSTAAELGANIVLRERERAARDAEHQLAVAVGAAQLGTWSNRLDTGEMLANDEWFRMLGLHPARDAGLAAAWRDRVHPEDRARLRAAYRRLDEPGKDSFVMELRLRHADGHWVWVQSRGTVLERGADGRPLRLAGVHLDMTRRRRDEAQLRISADAFENSHEGILVCDGDGKIISINSAFTRVTGYAADEVVGRRPSVLSSGHHGPEFYRAMWEQVHQHGRWEGEVWNRRKTGEVYPEWLVITRINHADGRTNYLGQFTDISERKLSQSRIEALARTDALTGLPNRQGFGERARAALRENGNRLAVMMLNIDRFKQVNDSFGFSLGDQVLVMLTQRLVGLFGEKNVLARVSGDEFAVLLPGAGETEARAIWTRLDAAMQSPFNVAGQDVMLGLSSGVALCPEHGEDAELLLVSANAALNYSRSEGLRRLCVYSPGQPGASLHRLTIESQLRLALQRHELFPVFQPQVSLRTGELVGIEALVRWRHPERGVVPPAEFIPVAEEASLVGQIGDFMLREACRTLRRLRDDGLPAVPVSVNIAASQLRREDFLPQLMSEVEHAGLDPSALEIELTESMLMTGTDQTISLLAALRERGFRLAIDDFGTGYSSLSYLGKLPMDRLKIDQSFVSAMGASEAADGIVRTVIALATSLHLNVLAEGVETEEHAARLRELGCDDAQGYLFARPMEAADLLAKYGLARRT